MYTKHNETCGCEPQIDHVAVFMETIAKIQEQEAREIRELKDLLVVLDYKLSVGRLMLPYGGNYADYCATWREYWDTVKDLNALKARREARKATTHAMLYGASMMIVSYGTHTGRVLCQTTWLREYREAMEREKERQRYSMVGFDSEAYERIKEFFNAHRPDRVTATEIKAVQKQQQLEVELEKAKKRLVELSEENASLRNRKAEAERTASRLQSSLVSAFTENSLLSSRIREVENNYSEALHKLESKRGRCWFNI